MYGDGKCDVCVLDFLINMQNSKIKVFKRNLIMT